MLKPLNGKVAIVTGGSRGIGRAIAQRLGADGAEVALSFAQDHVAAEEVVATIRQSGSRAIAVQARLDGPAPVRHLFAETLAAFGHLDILVNNAAVAKFGPITSVTEEELDTMVNVNVKAVFFAFQEAARQMSDGGNIVSISAALTRIGYDNTAAYAGTKGAVEQFSLAAARELGKRGIRVNVVSPGATDTELYRGLSTEQTREAARGRSPFGRLAEPEDIADIVAFLVSSDARWLSGQNLRANGGALW